MQQCPRAAIRSFRSRLFSGALPRRIFPASTSATSGTANKSETPAVVSSLDSGGGRGGGEEDRSYFGSWESVIKWSDEEEVDGVDEALAIAEAMFREAKERGDPDSPQAKALARMGRPVSY